MNKILKRSIAFAMMFAVLLSITTVAFAYDSTMSISDNSTLVGKEVTYSKDNYRLDITPNKMVEGPRSPGQVKLYTEFIRPLYRLGIKYGQQTKYSGTITFNVSSDLNKKKSTSMGNCGDGKRYLYFSTVGAWGAGYGSLSGAVTVYNYS